MKTRTRALLSFGSVFLALLLAIGVAPLLPNAQVLAAPGFAQGASVTNLPLDTCTLVGTTRTCELWATTGTVTLPTTAVLPVWGFADTLGGPAQVPGPVIVANAGETLEIVFHNELPGETVSLAFPGQMGLLADLDGVPTGGTATYSFLLGAPGTFLYEAGMTPNGSRQVAMGMYGALVVRPAGAANQAYDDPTTAFVDEALLVLGVIDPLFNADPNNYSMQFFKPQYWLINGLAYPNTTEIDTVAGNMLLLRYVNASHETQGMGALGLRQLVIGNDGYPVDPPYGVSSETIAAGQTMDMLVSVPAGTTADTRFALYNAALMNHNAGTRASNGTLAFGGMMTFINTVTGAPAWEPGPLSKNVAVTPNRTTGVGGATLTADIDDATTGGRNVTAAEYFIDSLGTPGSGTTISVAAAPQVSVSADLPASLLDTLPGGYHIFYVRGQDDGGFWGVPGAAVLNLDKIGPDSTTLSLSRDPSNGTVPVSLRGTGDDRLSGRGNVVAARYTLSGVTEPMTLNRTDLSVVEISALISTSVLSTLPEGLYPISVESQDDLGNWGAPGLITLTLDTTGPEAPAVTLTPAVLDLTQPLDVTSIRLDADIVDSLSSGVQSALAGAEGFVDVVGAPGEGFDLFPSDGLFDEVSESAFFEMPLAHFVMLPHGLHTVSVQAMDVAGNWGAIGEAQIFIDRGEGPPPPTDTVGPVITNASAAPNPTNGATNVTLTALASDPDSLSNIAAAEYYLNGNPALNRPMQAVDGAFDSPVEDLTASINVGGWPNTTLRLYVRAQDTAGNWGDPVIVALQIIGNQQAVVLNDGFETGDLAAWTDAVGSVSVVPEAALPDNRSGFGMQAVLDGAPAYVSHWLPLGETSYQASFRFDPNGADLGGAHHGILAGLDLATPIFGIEVEESGDNAGQYEIRAWALESGVPVYTGWYDITGGSKLGIRWQTSAAATFALLIDDVVVEELSGLDTSAQRLREIRLGPSSNLDAGQSGVEYFDAFEARRTLFTYLPGVWLTK